jgi:hypothetical protein
MKQFIKVLKQIYHPVLTPLLIGANLPYLIEEKKYETIPLVIIFPISYTGYICAKNAYQFYKRKLDETEIEKP